MIQEIIENKLDYATLLCESDPNINLVENYLRDGRLFAYFEKQTPLAFIAAKEINDTTVEIKNLLTLEKYRGYGYGKALIQHIEKLYQNKLTFLIGNFFIDYYPQEIYENNMQATDLLYFSKTRAN